MPKNISTWWTMKEKLEKADKEAEEERERIRDEQRRKAEEEYWAEKKRKEEEEKAKAEQERETEGKTEEAKVYKALDKLEAVIAHNESDISTWLPLEYELQQTYAAESVKGFPILEEIQRLAVEKTLEKIAEEKAGRNPDDGRREE